MFNRPNGPLGDRSVSTGYDMTDALAPEIILTFSRNTRSFFIGIDAVKLSLVLLDALFDALKNIVGLLGFDWHHHALLAEHIYH